MEEEGHPIYIGVEEITPQETGPSQPLPPMQFPPPSDFTFPSQLPSDGNLRKRTTTGATLAYETDGQGNMIFVDRPTPTSWKYWVKFVDRWMPERFNRPNKEEGGETPVLKYGKLLYVERQLWASRGKRCAIASLIIFIMICAVWCLLMSLLPGPRPPLIPITDEHGNQVDVWMPTLLDSEESVFFNLLKSRVTLHRSKGVWNDENYHTGKNPWSIPSESVATDLVELPCKDAPEFCETLPPVIQEEGMVHYSIGVLFETMEHTLRLSESYPLKNPLVPNYGKDGVSCAIEYGVPLNVMMVRKSNGEYVRMIDPVVMAHRMTGSIQLFPNILSNVPDQDMGTSGKASVEYVVPLTGRKSKILLVDEQKAHVLACIDRSWILFHSDME